MKIKKKNVAILISGKGSNMLALLKDLLSKESILKPVLVVADRKHAEGLKLAKKLGIRTEIVNYKDGLKKETCENLLIENLTLAKVDIVCLAGFMQILSPSFIKKFECKILNIHPSILPLFKGLNTHKKALDSGMIIHGATVHLVTEKVDSGRILGQAIIPILENDTENSLAKRVLKMEHKLYPRVLRRFAASKTKPLLIM